MMNRWVVIGLVLVAAAGAGILGLRSAPAGAQRAEDGGAAEVTSRYRVTVLRVAVPEGANGEALSLSEFAREMPGALVARSDAPGLKGHFGAVPCQKDLVYLLSQRGTAMEVIFAGETEAIGGTKATVTYGTRYPLQSVEVRGNQTIVTTKFEQMGAKVELERLPASAGNLHDIVAEFSSASAFTRDLNPVIFDVATRGRFLLPDGYTLVLSYLDRVEGALFTRTIRSLAEDTPAPTDVPADIVTQYFMLITRMDLGKQ